MGFNVPLDGSLQELCKSRVRVEISRQQAEADKARLDFELVRLLKCGEAKKSGIDFFPTSPYYKVCADINVVVPEKTPTYNDDLIDMYKQMSKKIDGTNQPN